MNLSTPLTSSIALLTLAATATAQTQRGVFVLDRSASMTISVSGGGGTRCDKSLMAIEADLINFFSDPTLPTEALIVEFDTDPGYYRVLGGGWHTTEAAARAAAASSVSCPGSATQLARSLCQAVTDMRGRIAAAPPEFLCPAFFYVYSDGGENSSSGSCAGGNDVNASNGRCPGDTLNAADPIFEFDANGLPSWQRLVCDQIANLEATPPAGCTVPVVFYATKFNDVTDGPATSSVFRFLDSVAASTGGVSQQVPDSQPFQGGGGVGGAISVMPTGCTSRRGERAVLDPIGIAQIGQSFGMRLGGTTLQVRSILFGFALTQRPVDLAVLGAAGCSLNVVPTQGFIGGFIPRFGIPQSRSLIGLRLRFQGVAATPTLSELVTTNTLTMTVQR